MQNYLIAKKFYLKMIISLAGVNQSGVRSIVTHNIGLLPELVILNDEKSIEEYLGFMPKNRSERAMSSRLARELAMKSYLKCRKSNEIVLGVGCSCRLQGDILDSDKLHYIHVAVQTRSATHNTSIVLVPGRQRLVEERITEDLIVYTIAKASGLDISLPNPMSYHHEIIDYSETKASRRLESLVLENNNVPVVFDPLSQSEYCVESSPELMISGTFDPVNMGQLEALKTVYNIDLKPIDIEIPINRFNLPLNYTDIWRIIFEFKELAKSPFIGRLWFTNTKNYVDKSELFPNTKFVVGVNEFWKMGRLKSYRFNSFERDKTVNTFLKNKNHFLIFDKVLPSEVQSLYPKLKELSTFVMVPSMMATDIW